MPHLQAGASTSSTMPFLPLPSRSNSCLQKSCLERPRPLVHPSSRFPYTECSARTSAALHNQRSKPQSIVCDKRFSTGTAGQKQCQYQPDTHHATRLSAASKDKQKCCGMRRSSRYQSTIGHINKTGGGGGSVSSIEHVTAKVQGSRLSWLTMPLVSVLRFSTYGMLLRQRSSQ
jgi:hypothetical protein